MLAVAGSRLSGEPRNGELIRRCVTPEAEHSAANWQMMLNGLKQHIEAE